MLPCALLEQHPPVDAEHPQLLQVGAHRQAGQRVVICGSRTKMASGSARNGVDADTARNACTQLAVRRCKPNRRREGGISQTGLQSVSRVSTRCTAGAAAGSSLPDTANRPPR